MAIFGKQFDILTDSALEISQGIVNKAYRGAPPVGGLDFPSACVLSRCTPDHSDLHIEVHDTSHDAALSDVDDVSNITYREEPGPSDTTSPFLFPYGEHAPPGPFGKALVAAGKLAALCIEYGTDYKPFFAHFKAQWGVPADVDLDVCIPRLRSHGVAMWGGIGRTLVVGMQAGGTTSVNVDVKFHTTGRKELGEKKICDWPRLRMLASSVGQMLLGEDNRFKGQVQRIDWRIVRREIPEAPDMLGIDFSKLPAPGPYEVGTHHLPAMQYIQQQAALAQHMAKHRGVDALTGESIPAMPASVLEQILRKDAGVRMPHISILDMKDEEPDFDIKEPTSAIDRQEAKEGYGNTVDNFEGIIHPYVSSKVSTFPNTFDFHVLINDLHSNDNKEATGARHSLVEMVWGALPADILVRYMRYAAFATCDKDNGWREVVRLLKDLDAPHSHFKQQDLCAVWMSLRTVRGAVEWVSRRFKAVLGRIRVLLGSQTVLNSRLIRILALPSDPGLVIEGIIRRRRNYWAHRYMSAAVRAETTNERVHLQLKAKLFRLAQVRITGFKDAVADFSGPYMSDALYQSYVNYIRKRRTRHHIMPPLPRPFVLSPFEMAAELDKSARASVSYTKVMEDVKGSLAYLVQDVRAIMRRITNARTVTDVVETHDLLEDDEVDIFSDDEVEVKQGGDGAGPSMLQPGWDDYQEEEMVVPAGAVVEEDELWGEICNPDTTIDLLDELKEDYPQVPYDIREQAVLQFGGRIEVEVYEQVRQFVHRKMMEMGESVQEHMDEEYATRIDLE